MQQAYRSLRTTPWRGLTAGRRPGPAVSTYAGIPTGRRHMTSVLTAGEYRDQLRRLLDRGKETFTDEEQSTLRLVVRERRNRRRGSEQTLASAAIDAHALAII